MKIANFIIFFSGWFFVTYSVYAIACLDVMVEGVVGLLMGLALIIGFWRQIFRKKKEEKR